MPAAVFDWIGAEYLGGIAGVALIAAAFLTYRILRNRHRHRGSRQRERERREFWGW